ncbi:MAG: T9SS type A sorting domain-containing protein [Bacteroidia bacterium]|nr:T9SS type A sorting domain-containing protein [Bacteroidia bacterium]
MKKNTLLLAGLLLFSFQFVNSQTWQPLRFQQDLHFWAPQDSLGLTVFVDSLGFAGSDSVFHLNRLMLDCDTCPFFSTWLGLRKYMLQNQPSMIGKTMRLDGNGKAVFEGPHQMVLLTRAGPGASWTSDTAQNITATITNAAYLSNSALIFGQSDSVKTIVFSNQDSLLLSKTYGILRFPANGKEWDLIGIPSKSLGEKIPGYWEIFDLQPGDMIEYEEYGTAGGTIQDEHGYLWKRKQLITNRVVTGDTITLTMQVTAHEQNRDHLVYTTSFLGVKNETWQIRKADYPTTQQYPFQKTYYDPNAVHYWKGAPDSTFGYDCSDPTAYLPTRAKKDINGRWKLLFEKLPYDGWGQYAYRDSANTDLMPISLYYEANYWRYYTEGLGVEAFKWFCFESQGHRNLIAYSKGGDTVGVFTPDSVLLAQNPQISAQFRFQVFPNPAGQQVNIEAELPRGTLLVLKDLFGREVRKISWQGPAMKIDLHELPNGIYVLVADRDGISAQKKLVVRH